MKNKYVVKGEVTTIFVKSKHLGEVEVLIDTEDLELLENLNNTWCVHSNRKMSKFYINGYHRLENGRPRLIHLHRYILNAPKGKVVDHLNGNTFDNRKANLRVVTQNENSKNQTKMNKNNKSGVTGVCWDRKKEKWRAKVGYNGKHIFLGLYEKLEDAKSAVEKKKSELGFINGGKVYETKR